MKKSKILLTSIIIFSIIFAIAPPVVPQVGTYTFHGAPGAEKILRVRTVNNASLEDLFGVEEVEKVRVHNLRAVKGNQAFCDRLTSFEEYTDHFACEGKYKAKTASVLIDAEIPILLTEYKKLW